MVLAAFWFDRTMACDTGIYFVTPVVVPLVSAM
jgi:hypothetical protein